MIKFIDKIKNSVLSLMFPEDIKCFFCLNELNENSVDNTCVECLKSLPYILDPCVRCGVNMDKENMPLCMLCTTHKYNFIQARSPFVYEGKPLEVVHKLKYNNMKYLSKHMAKYMGYTYGKWGVFADFVTSVPMFKDKEKKRGYNQATILAKDFCALAGLNYLECCRKIKDTESQTTLNIKERFENVENTFEILPEIKEKIKGKTILIIDDVITTGATVNELSKVLLAAGAKECFALSFAHASLRK